MSNLQQCGHCGGDGYLFANEATDREGQVCPECHGAGKVTPFVVKLSEVCLKAGLESIPWEMTFLELAARVAERGEAGGYLTAYHEWSDAREARMRAHLETLSEESVAAFQEAVRS